MIPTIYLYNTNFFCSLVHVFATKMCAVHFLRRIFLYMYNMQHMNRNINVLPRCYHPSTYHSLVRMNAKLVQWCNLSLAKKKLIHLLVVVLYMFNAFVLSSLWSLSCGMISRVRKKSKQATEHSSVQHTLNMTNKHYTRAYLFKL